MTGLGLPRLSLVSDAGEVPAVIRCNVGSWYQYQPPPTDCFFNVHETPCLPKVLCVLVHFGVGLFPASECVLCPGFLLGRFWFGLHLRTFLGQFSRPPRPNEKQHETTSEDVAVRAPGPVGLLVGHEIAVQQDQDEVAHRQSRQSQVMPKMKGLSAWPVQSSAHCTSSVPGEAKQRQAHKYFAIDVHASPPWQ